MKRTPPSWRSWCAQLIDIYRSLILRSLATSTLLRTHRFGNHLLTNQPRTSRIGQPRMQSISHQQILHFDHLLACFCFYLSNFSFYLFYLPIVTRLWWQDNGLIFLFSLFNWSLGLSNGPNPIGFGWVWECSGSVSSLIFGFRSVSGHTYIHIYMCVYIYIYSSLKKTLLQQRSLSASLSSPPPSALSLFLKPQFKALSLCKSSFSLLI